MGCSVPTPLGQFSLFFLPFLSEEWSFSIRRQTRQSSYMTETVKWVPQSLDRKVKIPVLGTQSLAIFSFCHICSFSSANGFYPTWKLTDYWWSVFIVQRPGWLYKICFKCSEGLKKEILYFALPSHVYLGYVDISKTWSYPLPGQIFKIFSIFTYLSAVELNLFLSWSKASWGSLISSNWMDRHTLEQVSGSMVRTHLYGENVPVAVNIIFWKVGLMVRSQL